MRDRRARLLGIALFTLSIPGMLHAAANLIENNGFEMNELGNLPMWSMEAYTNTVDSVRFFVTEIEKHGGKQSLAIANLKPNDARAIQWVKVKPGTRYKLSCWIQARGVQSEAIGANISVLGSNRAAGDLKDTEGRWQYVELIGKTGPEQYALGVLLRLGFYGSLATGMALFDDVVLEDLAASPSGSQEVVDFSNNKAVGLPIVRSSRVIVHGPPGFVGSWLFYTLVGVLAAAVAALIVVMALPRLRQRAAPMPYRGIEHRGAPRSPFAGSIMIKRSRPRQAADILHCTASNLSEIGIFLKCGDPLKLALGDELQLQVAHEGKAVSLGKAAVVRVRAEYDRRGKLLRCGVGLRFTASNPAARKARSRLLPGGAGAARAVYSR
jgi:hypothetical protein